MVRTVKSKTTRALKKGESSVLFPSATGAEAWEWWALGETPVCLRTFAESQEIPSPRDATTLAWPVAQVFCLPLWINETDAQQFPDIIKLQLEMRGLHPRGDVVFDWSIVSREASRTLVVVGVLPSHLALEVEAEGYAWFDVSARYLAFPENALVLWREHDRLALALTRGEALIYFQPLADRIVTARIVQDMICIRTSLAMQNVITTLTGGVVLWYEAEPAEISALGPLQLPTRTAERPSPQSPPKPWKLLPIAVRETRKARKTSQWRRRALVLAAMAYLLLAALLGARYFLLAHQVEGLRQWQSNHAQALNLVHETEAAWKELQPVVDRDGYPLEILYQVSQSIPRDQLHLTLFEVENGRLLVKGEAKNVAAAFQFFDQLKKDFHFSSYDLEMPQPHLLPNDLAQFQIEGTRPAVNLP